MRLKKKAAVVPAAGHDEERTETGYPLRCLSKAAPYPDWMTSIATRATIVIQKNGFSRWWRCTDFSKSL